MRSRQARLAFSLTILAALLTSSALEPSQALAGPLFRNRVTREGDTVTITVPIDLHGALGRGFRNRQTGESYGAQGLASYWESGAESIWNSGLSAYLYRGCYTLKVDTTIDVIPLGQPGSADHHHVWLMLVGYRSHVYRGGDSRRAEDNSAPYQNSAEGFWGYINAAVVAHEIGHFLGFADDYTDVTNSQGQVTGSSPNEGRSGTLLANGVTIDQEIVDRLGDMVAEQLELAPCFNGTVDIVQEEQEDNSDRTATLNLALSVSPDANGRLTGLATGTFGLSGVYHSGGCEFSFSMSSDVSLDLTASGSGDGPYSVRSVAPKIIEETHRYYLCSDPVDYTMRWEVSLAVDDVLFEDGYYSESSEGSETVLFYIGHE